ncbi:DUF2254 domain-containing protein [Pedobacter endophyticus]|uniref:DUF2254 domain-containing protein n=1 Tax=Pedobacter endophyticus TaxID=2789740 RepID=A0A7U3Q4T7_9SPHI|nr:DUF2254 domain-containing protein [Pedobacter endophyticus]QPH38605.1 DUF2254 domain-containing protein [Pedobacter endophyticus]
MIFGQVSKSLKIAYHKTVSSIAFYPAVIAVGFLIFSWLMLELDVSGTGKYIKAHYSWVRLKDASTARTIVSTIAGGIISLMVFSFSMVMILLNQAASQMSNRMLESMIGNRFQQCVLGLYIGTIVYSLFLLSTIRDIESGIYVPALSIYLLLMITVVDIFVFIYFLHYVTQSVKFETIIERVHKQTLESLKNSLITADGNGSSDDLHQLDPQFIFTRASGYYQGFDRKQLVIYAAHHDLLIEFKFPPGTYLLEGQEFLKVYSTKPLDDKNMDELLVFMDFYPGQPVDHNFYYGFHQLTEVALKALSPGINDPETAILSLHALSDLFLYRLNHEPEILLRDDQKRVRIILKDRTFIELFTDCIYPVWDYGCNDRYIQNALYNMISKFRKMESSENLQEFFSKMLEVIQVKVVSSELPNQFHD